MTQEPSIDFTEVQSQKSQGKNIESMPPDAPVAAAKMDPAYAHTCCSSAVRKGNQDPLTLSREGDQDPLPETSIHIRGEDCLITAGREQGKVCLLVFGKKDGANGPAQSG